MKSPYVILLLVVGVFAALWLIINMGTKQMVREVVVIKEVPVEAIGCSVNGGYVYRNDFIGALNEGDIRAE